MKQSILNLLLVSIFTSMIITSCNNTNNTALQGEILFPLRLGVLESNLNIFSFGNVTSDNHPALIMRNGIFALSDPANSKIMEFTSYGDLLNLYYNPAKNPPPLTLRIQSGGNNSGSLVNKLAHQHSFENIGHIAYSRSNMLLVQDRVPETRIIYDDARGVYLNQVILRFTSQGEYQDYIGQEGIGGTAFPSIRSIQVTANNHLVVFSQVPNGELIFWFNELGDLLFSVEFESQHLPKFEREGYIPVLDQLFPHMKNAELLLKIDFHPQQSSSGDTTGSQVESRMYKFDLSSGVYTGYFELPQNIQRRQILSPTENPEIQYLYQFLGIDDRGILFFISRMTDIQHQLLLTDQSGKVLYRGFIDLNDATLMLRELWVNEQGILVGLLVYDDRGEVVWWRTDRVVTLD